MNTHINQSIFIFISILEQFFWTLFLSRSSYFLWAKLNHQWCDVFKYTLALLNLQFQFISEFFWPVNFSREHLLSTRYTPGQQLPNRNFLHGKKHLRNIRETASSIPAKSLLELIFLFTGQWRKSTDFNETSSKPLNKTRNPWWCMTHNSHQHRQLRN